MESSTQKHQASKVHHVLAHSYTVYLILLLVGVMLDFIFRIKIFSDSIMAPVGFTLLIVATILILWAQKTGRDFKKFTEIKKEHFKRGPYRYSRFPTQWGLFLLMLGFGIITNAFFVMLSTLVSFAISKAMFAHKHDTMLIEKYGEAYKEYKKLVRF